ncbi:MAG: hypothetical protein R3C03_19825 [Pirellulaceae bacterium]
MRRRFVLVIGMLLLVPGWCVAQEREKKDSVEKAESAEYRIRLEELHEVLKGHEKNLQVAPLVIERTENGQAVLLRLDVNGALKMELEHFVASLTNLSSQIEKLERLSNQLSGEPLKSQQEMFESAEQFGKNAKRYIHELSERFKEVEVESIDSLMEHDDAAHDEAAKAKERAVAKYQMQRLQEKEKMAAERLVAAEQQHKMAVQNQTLLQLLAQKQAEGIAREATAENDRVESLEQRLSRIEELLEKLTKDK